ncbi:cell division protein ZipA [Nitrincola sp. A-D6]|uniref:cell division protein ZipA n=1 Tax=Nitrincola sp. A-D6 TaxID=1545442 RepID=UPI00068DC7B3|nr:cell division protein ZipA [Nitrincola sp. A-D6]
MEISLREWLIIGAIFVIALILFDGWRRIRANRNRLRIDIDKTLSEIGETSHHNPELPNGGARVRSSVEPPLTASSQEPGPQQPVTKQFQHSDYAEPGSDSLDIGFSKSEPEPEVPVAQKVQETAASADDRTEASLPESDDIDIPMLNDINPTELQDGMIEAFDLPSETTPVTTTFTLDEGDAEDDVQPPSSESVEPEPVTEQSEWDPELERQFDNFDEPEPEPEPELQAHKDTVSLPEDSATVSENSKTDYSGLDPLFDEIPSDPFDRDAPDQEAAQSNLYLDLDLEQPIHQIMANKAAAKGSVKDDSKEDRKDTNKDYSRRVAEKPRRRQVENPSFTLPLDEPEDDLPSDMGLSALESEFESEYDSEPQAESPSKPKTTAPKAQAPSTPEVSDNRAAETQAASSVASKSAAASARKALSDMPDPDEVLVITVVGRDRQKLPGEPLKKVVEACGMEFGDMSIYHRFEGDAAASSLQFSMANAVNPGTFDPEAMEELETPAVSFFMSMREPKDPMTAYECMLATAETLAKHLDGDLLDEDRSVMREQTKEHYRQRIRDFEMQSRRRKLGR